MMIKIGIGQKNTLMLSVARKAAHAHTLNQVDDYHQMISALTIQSNLIISSDFVSGHVLAFYRVCMFI